jgi:hypothetical protein
MAKKFPAQPKNPERICWVMSIALLMLCAVVTAQIVPHIRPNYLAMTGKTGNLVR